MTIVIHPTEEYALINHSVNCLLPFTAVSNKVKGGEIVAVSRVILRWSLMTEVGQKDGIPQPSSWQYSM